MAAKKNPSSAAQPGLTQGIGTPGLRRTGGYIDADFIPLLNGINGIRQYAEMAANDPVIGAILFAISMSMRRVNWRTAPNAAIMRAENKGEMKKAQDMADLLQTIIDDMEHPMNDAITNVCEMFTYGFAPLEIVYKKRDDGTLGWTKFSLRAQDTLQRWELADSGDILGMWQQDWVMPPVFIPIDRLLLFRTTPVKNNPEGRSILRTSYTSWKRKKVLEEAEGRALMRQAGLVVTYIPGELMRADADDQQKKVFIAWQEIAKNIALDRQGGVVMPSDVHPETKEKLYDVKYVVADGRRPADMGTSIDRYDKRIAGSVLADWILLGQQAVGSYAMSADKTDMFTEALKAWVEVAQSVFNIQGVKRLWELNGLDAKYQPTIQAGDLQKQDMQKLADVLGKLAMAGMPLFPDQPLEDYVRESLGLPKASPELDQLRETALNNGVVPGSNDEKIRDEGPPQDQGV